MFRSSWLRNAGLSLTVFLTGRLAAQDLRPASELLQPQQLKAAFVYWGQDLMVMARDTQDGRPVVRAYHAPLTPARNTQDNYDTDLLDGTTLQPLAKYHPQGDLFYHYLAGNRVRLTMVAPSGDTTTAELAVPGRVYNFRGPAVGVLTAALPLAEGFATRFHVLEVDFPYATEANPRVVAYRLRVLGREQITVAGKQADTFVTEVEPEVPGAGTYYKAWVLATAPHVALRFIYARHQPDESHRQRQPYTVRDYFVPR